MDGYSTCRDFVPELLERNVECLHLRSTEQLPAPVAKSFDPTLYDGDLGYVGGVRAAVALLADLKPDAVIAGSEWGVTFAEHIAHAMKLPTNRIETINARRNKFDMIEAVRPRGLLVADQASVSSVAAAHGWADDHGIWPIIVKPMTSAGADGVTVCNNHDDIDAAFVKALHRNNFMAATTTGSSCNRSSAARSSSSTR